MKKNTYVLLGVLFEGIKIEYPDDYFDIRHKVWTSTDMKSDLSYGSVLPGMVFRDSEGKHFIVKDHKLEPIILNTKPPG